MMSPCLYLLSGTLPSSCPTRRIDALTLSTGMDVTHVKVMVRQSRGRGTATNSFATHAMMSSWETVRITNCWQRSRDQCSLTVEGTTTKIFHLLKEQNRLQRSLEWMSLSAYESPFVIFFKFKSIPALIRPSTFLPPGILFQKYLNIRHVRSQAFLFQNHPT